MLYAGVVAVLAVLAVEPTWAQQYTIKFASLAPEGTTWMTVMREYDAALRKESGGRMGFKIYSGGVQGEDKDVLRKIRLGQLHSAGLTGFGLGEIASKLRILDGPFLFDNYYEVDHLYETLDADFRRMMEENNFILLGWAEVGFVYVFTNTPVRAPGEMNGVRMWMWEGDPIAEATFKAFGVKPVPLSIIEVLTSLQTGLINAAYISPLAAIGMQWNTRVKFMLNVPLADASGAVVISKKMYDTLPPDLQEILLRLGKKYMGELKQKSRDENARAIQTMMKEGVQVIEPSSPKAMDAFRAAGRVARQSLVGNLYDQPFLDRVEKIVKDFRAKHSSPK